MANILFPLGGRDESLSYEFQAPYTTPRARNVRPKSVIDRRAVGGSRPGLSKLSYTQLGGGNPIRLVDVVNTFQADNFDFYHEGFDGYQADQYGGDAFSSAWSQQFFADIPTLTTYRCRSCAMGNDTTERGLVGSTSVLTNLSATAYRIGILILPYRAVHRGTYRIYARMNDTSPVATTDSVIAELTLTPGGGYSGSLKRYASGVLTTHLFTVGSLGSDMPGYFELDVSSTTTVKVYWQGVQLISQTVAAAAGNRFGFSLQATTEDYPCLIDSFELQYFRTSKFELARPRLYASANGSFYRETYFRQMEAVSSSCTLASDRRILSAEYGNKLYIADWGDPLAAASDGSVTNNSVDSATYTDWTTLGISTNDHSMQLVSAPDNSDVLPGSHRITTIASNALTVRPSAAASGSNIVFRVVRHPKVYDPTANTLTPWESDYHSGTVSVTTGVATLTGVGDETSDWWAGRSVIIDDQLYTIDTVDDLTQFTITDTTLTTSGDYYVSKGQIPLGCRGVRRWGGRIYLFGDPTAPQGLYASGIDDPNEWDFGQDLTTSAWYSGTSALNIIGFPVVDMIPWRKDLAIIACSSALYLLVGDPRAGGRIEEMALGLGLTAPNAWAVIPTGECVFLTNEGVYITNTQCENCYPIPFSVGKLPNEFRGLNSHNCEISFDYDEQFRGVHISIAHKTRRGGVNQWWLDFDNKRLWPDVLPVNKTATATCRYPSIEPGEACTIIAGADGYLRRLYEPADNDDGDTLISNVLIGPLKMGNLMQGGMFRSFRAALAEPSGPIGVRFFVGRSAEEALRKYDADQPHPYDGTFLPGELSRVLYPRAVGSSAFIELSGQGEAWAGPEAMEAIIEKMGFLLK